MHAELIAVGTELLGASRLDTNSLFLTRELAAVGIPVSRKSVLPDDVERLSVAIAGALSRAPLVICCGGLGPTCDDCTREAAARALHCSLVRDADQLAHLRDHFARRNRAMPANNVRQADRLAAAIWLPNEFGTAPGQWCRASSAVLVLLPGPPRELEPLFVRAVRPRLVELGPSRSFATRTICVVGRPESEVDAIAAPIYRGYPDVNTTILSTAGPQIELHFQAQAATPAEAEAAANAVADRVAQQLGDAVFSRHGECLSDVVGQLLASRHQTVALAESCTGGLVGERLTRRPGSSSYFQGGVVSYSNEAKINLLGVRPATLESAGAVSEPCACEMAMGARQKFGSDWGLAITGIAGPEGGSPEKPVGTVWLGLAGPGSPPVAARSLCLPGSRDRIRHASAQSALDWLRLSLR